MQKTYEDSYRYRRLGKLSALMMLGAGILLWKYQRNNPPAPDAWTASIPRNVMDTEQSRKEQKEQMKKAFRLAEAASTQEETFFHAYQQVANGASHSNKEE